MEENQLKMNDAKTEFIIFGTTNNLKKNTLHNIKIGNTKIHRTSKIKFLGVNLDEKLSLKDHVQNRSKKPITTSCLFITFVNTLILTLLKCYCPPWY